MAHPPCATSSARKPVQHPATYGLSCADTARFARIHEHNGLLPEDPFVTIDLHGTGELVRIATERGGNTRPVLKLGICGEHGGDPASIRFCAEVALDYVSCSASRMPIARLAAAQAALTGITREVQAA